MADYYSIITNRGKELEAEALASGRPIVLTQFVVGDSNGKQIKPDPEQIRLVHETFRGDIAALVVSPEQASQLMAKIVLPTNVGGFTVREVGLLTDSGELYAVANCPSIDKPAGGVSVNMQFRLAISDTSNITLNVATGDGLFLRIDQNLKEIKARGDDAQRESRESIGVLDATNQRKGLVQLNSAVNSTSETQGATPAAVRIAMENANARLAKERNGADIPNKSLFIQNVGLQETVDKAAGAIQRSEVQTSRDDVTPGRVLVNGSAIATRNIFASSSPEAFADDANNLPVNSVSFVYASAKNSPGFEASILDYAGLNDGYSTQIAASYAQPGKLRFRTRNGDFSTWNPWLDIITSTGGCVDALENATYYKIGSQKGWYGAGAFVDQYNNNAAPFMVPLGKISPKDQNTYYPIVKGSIQTEYYGYGTAVSFGTLVGGNADFAKATIQVIGDNGSNGLLTLDANGRLNVSGQVIPGDLSNFDARYAIGDWVSTVGIVSNDENIPYMRSRATGNLIYLAGQNWVVANFVQNVMRGAQGSMTMDGALVEAPAGCFLTGGNGNEGNQVGIALYRPLQIWRGNGWATISG